jgi:uncharacterized protein with ParB-like and HNH nuclease domain
MKSPRNKNDILLTQIIKRAKEIHAEAYPMSIGELISIYKEKELDIHPEFQRFFRWSNIQKSKFIESILLGIPTPSIFVSHREDGVWDVVDGVQRLSTIFEFIGIYLDDKNEKLPGSTLTATDYLPALEGIKWENPETPDCSFPEALKLDFKRQKIDLKIVKKESDENTKYDLFERLNTLGSHLSDQEVRNCLLVMINKEFYTWLRKIADNESFVSTTSLTDRLIKEKYDMELALRFIVFSRADIQDLKNIQDIGDFITKKMRSLAQDSGYTPITSSVEMGVFSLN